MFCKGRPEAIAINVVNNLTSSALIRFRGKGLLIFIKIEHGEVIVGLQSPRFLLVKLEK